jgi:hypothetical protein
MVAGFTFGSASVMAIGATTGNASVVHRGTAEGTGALMASLAGCCCLNMVAWLAFSS